MRHFYNARTVFFCLQIIYKKNRFKTVAVFFLVLLYQISSADGSSQIGMISKHWTGFVREFFTDAENFGIRCKEPCQANVTSILYYHSLITF